MTWRTEDSRRRRERYYDLRQSIFATLGWECAMCAELREDIQVDHPRGRNWEPREVDSITRQRRYLAELERIRPLCKKCNGGYRPRRKHERKPRSVKRR